MSERVSERLASMIHPPHDPCPFASLGWLAPAELESQGVPTPVGGSERLNDALAPAVEDRR